VIANPGPRPRSGAIRIAGRVHTVSQAAPPRCTVEFEPKRILVGAAGGSGALTVTSRREECVWTAASDSPWVVITSGASGTGSGTLQFRVDPSPDGAPRRGRIRVGTRAVIVRQLPGPVVPEKSP